jgi:uncharacterized protein (DUF885 family)
MSDAERLHQVFAKAWATRMHDYPDWATFTGWPGENHRWTDLSLEAVEKRRRDLDVPLRELASVDRAALGPEDQLSFDLFRREAEIDLAGRRFPSELLALNQLGGVQIGAPQLMAAMPRRGEADLLDALARLEALPRHIDQTIALLREGVRAGIVPPRGPLADVPTQIQAHLSGRSALLAPFEGPVPGVPDERLAELKADAESVVGGAVRAAWDRLLLHVADEYLPSCRESVGLSDLPDGEAWYEHEVRRFTTTSLTAADIHELGLAEVQRIVGEMDAVVREAGFAGTREEYGEHLRTSPGFFFASAAELLAAYRDICKRADAGLVELFGHLPRLPYGVVPVPDYAERSAPTAYYEPGSWESARPGKFFANTYDLRSRPRWEMEALALHEAVPGHHLQIALAQEQPGLPDFRRHGLLTAYVEGWGLYAESLGSEMGFYQEPEMKWGRLTYEGWRAVRLVVDTGIHARHWTREQAVDYFVRHSSKTRHDVEVEVDRYIVWPGQALAYKIGELCIRRLRRRAEEVQGAAFDRRAFHGEVLSAGAVPLDVLESRVGDWMERSRPADAGRPPGSA